MALHPNQAELVCACHDGHVRLVDLVAGKIIDYEMVWLLLILRLDSDFSQAHSEEIEPHIRSVAVSPNGKLLVVGDDSYPHKYS